ncbi:UdgX family uracil-DNA binding protein [Mycobacterium sp. WMMD1722]|uniref:UdgX family uracil-DNA binding protein n=1 Tax=Mycobacterium sp. WMMD1722 TaxID=3404117 RepID=UPI003BF53AC3
MASAAPGAADFVPADTRDLSVLADAAQACTGCDLYIDATRAVLGEGRRQARVVMIGEQPGDQEDRAGRPFVGPAGKLLDRALAAADIDRDLVYVTNAVKHFKFTRPERGTRRIHKTPSRTEVVACRPWLFAELDAVRPDIVVLLGATAAKALMGNDFRLTAHRGEVLRLPSPLAGTDLDIDPEVVATVHPSSVLRGPPEDRERAFDALADDLRVVARLMAA